MRRYLSFGGGLNSTALLLWLLDRGVEFEAVYADLDADWPETRAYVQMLIDQGYPIVVLPTRRKGMTLWEWCVKYAIMPSRWQRWCTQEYKVLPLRAHFERPAIVYLGIDAGEAQRAKPSGDETLEHIYPLVDEGIDRAGCREIITAHGLPLPIKSGCFFCPFQRVGQWVELRTRHPELYCRARSMEEATNERLTAKGGQPIYLSSANKPLDAVAMADQMDLFGERGVRPCLCGL